VNAPTQVDPKLQSPYEADYTYTDNDQRLTENVTQLDATNDTNAGHAWTFGYDTEDQLNSVIDNATETQLYSYPYDAIGNRTDGDGVNSMNQSPDFQYDVHGNITDDGQFTYTWDNKGRLTSAEPDYPDSQSQKEVFTYDPQNRRTQEDILTWDSDNQDWIASSTLKFVYNGSQMVAELNGQNQLLQSYAWGPDGRLLSITDYTGGTPTNYQVVTDGSGSVVELLNSATGLVAASYQYDPWGNPTSATGPAANVSPFRWQGEFYDASFNGYYMGAREGSARLHIFLSPDPSGEGSDPNLYRMLGNDPINNTDPTGLRFNTLLSLWNKATTIASAMNNPTQFMVDHPQMVMSAMATAKNMAIDSANNPQAFQAGQAVGVVDTAVHAATGPAKMYADAKDTGIRIIGEAVNAKDSSINAAIAFDQTTEMLRLPDQLRQQGADRAIQFMGSVYGDPRAVQSGATFGAIEFNMGMLLTAAIDLPGALDTIGEGILQTASWVSKLSEGAEAETASLLSGVQSFSPNVANSVDAAIRIPIPGDADFVGPIAGDSWTLSPNGMGAHLVERVNVKGRPSLASLDQAATPTYYPYGTPEAAGAAHLRLHEATAAGGISLRSSGISQQLTDEELLEAYGHAYSDPVLQGILGDLRVPGGPTIDSNLDPKAAYDALMNWLGTRK